MKKLFGQINLNWPKVIILAIFVGVYTAVMAMIPAAKDTSFTDLAVTMEVWVLFGIFIIMNSKSAIDSALKCFVFFLVSQPLIYLVQDVVNHSSLFVTYYKFWFMITVLTLPMGFVGYYMKKDKWWGLLILAPMLLLVGTSFGSYLSKTIYSFPRHLLTTIFSAATMVMYPLAIFNNKKIKIVGVILSILIIVVMAVQTMLNPLIYNTTVLVSGGEMNTTFDDTYKVYLADEKYGEVYIEYDTGIEEWMVNAKFKKAGETQVILEAPSGEKTTFNIVIKNMTYDLTKK